MNVALSGWRVNMNLVNQVEWGGGQKMNWCRNDSIDGCRCGGAQFSGTRSQPASMRGGQKARKIIGRWCDSIKWRTHTHTLDSCRLHFHGERPRRALLCDRISHDAQNRIDFRGQSNRCSTFFFCLWLRLWLRLPDYWLRFSPPDGLHLFKVSSFYRNYPLECWSNLRPV